MQLIGLTGLNASGKGTVADYLKDCGFAYYSLSDIVRDYATEKGLDHSRENLIHCGNELREKHGPGVLAIKAVEKLKKDGHNKVVVDSIRNIFEIAELKKIPGFFLIGIDAPAETRFERSKKRGRVGFETDLKAFIEIEQKENSADPNKQQLFECLKLAQARVQNSGSIEELKEKIKPYLMS